MIECMICRKDLKSNDYVFVIKEGKYLCLDCALDHWRYWDIVTSDEMYNDGDYDSCWEQEFGPDYGDQKCSLCNEELKEGDEAIIINKKEGYHVMCTESYPSNYHGGCIYDEFEDYYNGYQDSMYKPDQVKDLKMK